MILQIKTCDTLKSLASLLCVAFPDAYRFLIVSASLIERDGGAVFFLVAPPRKFFGKPKRIIRNRSVTERLNGAVTNIRNRLNVTPPRRSTSVTSVTATCYACAGIHLECGWKLRQRSFYFPVELESSDSSMAIFLAMPAIFCKSLVFSCWRARLSL